MFAQQFAANRLNDALFGYSIERTNNIRPDDRFAHYTSVDVAAKIIGAGAGQRSLWLRNAQGMNDFSEVRHGLDCLNEAFDDWRLNARFHRVLNAIKEGMAYDIMMPMMESDFFMADKAYLTSLSLHDRDEASMGKLSMWRAYGGPNNVCLIFNTQPFMTPQTSRELVLSPVLYGGPAEFKRELEAFIQRLERCVPQLSSLDSNVVQNNIARALDFAVLSTKHQGFNEEVEWRVIYHKSDSRADPPCQNVTFNGKNERIYHLPIENDKEGGIWGASLDEALDRVIVGPVENPSQTKERLIQLLCEEGISHAEERVVHCGIPFRHK